MTVAKITDDPVDQGGCMFIDAIAEQHANIVTKLEMVAAIRAALKRTRCEDPRGRPCMLMVYTQVTGEDVPHFGVPPGVRLGPIAFQFFGEGAERQSTLDVLRVSGSEARKILSSAIVGPRDPGGGSRGAA